MSRQIPWQESQSKEQLSFFENVQERLHNYIHAKIEATDRSENIYKPFRDTSRVPYIVFYSQ